LRHYITAAAVEINAAASAANKLDDVDPDGILTLMAKTSRGRGVIENKHSTDVESPPPPLGDLLRTSTRPTLNGQTESARLYEQSPSRYVLF